MQYEITQVLIFKKYSDESRRMGGGWFTETTSRSENFATNYTNCHELIRDNSVQHEMVELQCFFLCETLLSFASFAVWNNYRKGRRVHAKDVMHVVEN